MARNLLDDEDWAKLGQIVAEAVDTQLAVMEDGILARIDHQAVNNGDVLAELLGRAGEPAGETLAARAQIREAVGLVAQLKRVIGSGNLRTEQQGQVNNLFAQLIAQLGGTVTIPKPAPAAPAPDPVVASAAP
jgi:hypothetical protein